MVKPLFFAKVLLLPVLLIFSASNIKSQNLVLNPSFEDITSCPQGPTQFPLAVNWDDCNSGADTCSSPDLLATCCTSPIPIIVPPVGVPNNILGSQEARTGENYAGIIMKESMALMGCQGFDIDTYREYIQGQFSAPLVAGQTYCVQFYVSLAGNVKWGTDQFGVYFSNTPVQYDFCNNDAPLPLTPQLEYTGPALLDTINWVELSWSYTATGGERYIVIGNFSDNATTVLYDSNCASMNPYCYYYIEDVYVGVGDCQIEPGELVVTLHANYATCGLQGSATIDVTSSCTGNPTISWSNGASGATVNNLAPGNYSVTVSDGAQCNDTVINFTIASTGAISVDITQSGDACTGPFSATANVTGANAADCTFAWSTTPAQSTQTATNLAAGTYTVTVNYGTCSETATINITGGTVLVDIALTGDLCAGPITATANVNGVDPADCIFQWSTTPQQTSQAITITSEGTYTVTVTADGCSGTDGVNIIFSSVAFSVEYDPEFCAGTTTPAVVTVTEGQPPYSYDWSTGSQASNININTTGNYSITVTDAYGCTAAQTISVLVHPGISLNADVYNISCFGEQDGAIATNVSGGTAPFNYFWYNLSANTDSIGGLFAGNYTLTVTDANGCSATDHWYVYEPQVLIFNLGTPASICSGDSTPLVVNVFGGTQPYTYHWSDNPSLSTPNRMVAPTETTTYTVSVTDANGCTTTSKSVTITVSPAIVLSIQTTDALCYESCDGSATLNIVGGVEPFIISWNQYNSLSIDELCAGDYSVTVTDNFGCIDSIDFSISQPDSIWSLTHSYPSTCFGSTDGVAIVNAFGGVPFDTVNNIFIYNYHWSNGATNDTMTAAGGWYTVTITDDNGCTARNQVFIEQPAAVFVTPIYNAHICIGQFVNYVAHATGGDGFYTFTWNGSDGTQYFGENITVNPTITTSYTLIVNDSHNCTGNTQTVTVTVNPPLNILNVEATPDSICAGEFLSVELDIEGGNGGPYSIYYDYEYIVENPHVFSPQQTGYVAYMVTDLCGTPPVRDSVFVTVLPAPLNAFFADRTRACPPAVINFTENSPNIGQSYLWDFGDNGFSVNKNPSHTYRESGTFDVTLTVWSEWGCENTQSFSNMITIWPKPRAEFIATPEVMSIMEPLVVFTNLSDDANIFFWHFGDGESSLWTDTDPAHMYEAPGEYDIMLIARNSYECMDTAMKRIRIHDEFTFYAPTAFSPNGDGVNDYFYVTGNGINPNDFIMYVYDRWGNKLFVTETFAPDQPYKMAWDGTFNGDVLKGDKILPNGVYKWYCIFTDLNNNPHEESGLIYLVK